MKQEFLQEGFDKQLVHVVEECSEVIKIACKIQRFGVDSVNPLTNIPNLDRLYSEMDDIMIAIERLKETLKLNETV